MDLDEIRKSLVPAGTVVMWSGPADAIPDGWALCDGKGGTPDLTDRFIRGAGRDGHGPAPFTSGEAEDHQHFVDPPAVTVRTNDAGSHSHLFPERWYDRKFDASVTAPYAGIHTGNDLVDQALVQADGIHSHSVAVDIGDFVTHSTKGSIRPRWFALCFIRKT